MPKKKSSADRRRDKKRMKSRFNFTAYEEYALMAYDKHEIFMYGKQMSV